jgi:hypothetical protein
MLLPSSNLCWGQPIEKDSRDSLVEARTFHILVKSNEEANALYESVVQAPRDTRLAAFKKLAKKSTIDYGSLDSGGDLGYIMEGSMVRPFEEKMLTEPVGSISKPFKTEFGWHLIFVTERRQISVGKVCEDALKKSIKAASAPDREKLELSLQKESFEQIIPQIKNLVAPNTIGPLKDENSNATFISVHPGTERHNERHITVHTELRYPKIAPTSAGLACYRSTRRFFNVNCRDRTLAFAGYEALEGRAAQGRKLLNTRVSNDHLNYSAVVPQSLGAQLYEAACGVQHPRT